jgi:hypothetical protein
MGTVTGNIINKLRPARRGGDQLGPCEMCSKPMSEAFVAQEHREYKRADGELYTSPMGGGVYGHGACLQNLGPFANC